MPLNKEETLQLTFRKDSNYILEFTATGLFTFFY